MIVFQMTIISKECRHEVKICWLDVKFPQYLELKYNFDLSFCFVCIFFCAVRRVLRVSGPILRYFPIFSGIIKSSLRVRQL